MLPNTRSSDVPSDIPSVDNSALNRGQGAGSGPTIIDIPSNVAALPYSADDAPSTVAHPDATEMVEVNTMDAVAAMRAERVHGSKRAKDVTVEGPADDTYPHTAVDVHRGPRRTMGEVYPIMKNSIYEGEVCEEEVHLGTLDCGARFIGYTNGLFQYLVRNPKTMGLLLTSVIILLFFKYSQQIIVRAVNAALRSHPGLEPSDALRSGVLAFTTEMRSFVSVTQTLGWAYSDGGVVGYELATVTGTTFMALAASLQQSFAANQRTYVVYKIPADKTGSGTAHWGLVGCQDVGSAFGGTPLCMYTAANGTVYGYKGTDTNDILLQASGEYADDQIWNLEALATVKSTSVEATDGVWSQPTVVRDVFAGNSLYANKTYRGINYLLPILFDSVDGTATAFAGIDVNVQHLAAAVNVSVANIEVIVADGAYEKRNGGQFVLDTFQPDLYWQEVYGVTQTPTARVNEIARPIQRNNGGTLMVNGSFFADGLIYQSLTMMNRWALIASSPLALSAAEIEAAFRALLDEYERITKAASATFVECQQSAESQSDNVFLQSVGRIEENFGVRIHSLYVDYALNTASASSSSSSSHPSSSSSSSSNISSSSVHGSSSSSSGSNATSSSSSNSSSLHNATSSSSSSSSNITGSSSSSLHNATSSSSSSSLHNATSSSSSSLHNATSSSSSSSRAHVASSSSSSITHSSSSKERSSHGSSHGSSRGGSSSSSSSAAAAKSSHARHSSSSAKDSSRHHSSSSSHGSSSHADSGNHTRAAAAVLGAEVAGAAAADSGSSSSGYAWGSCGCSYQNESSGAYTCFYTDGQGIETMFNGSSRLAATTVTTTSFSSTRRSAFIHEEILNANTTEGFWTRPYNSYDTLTAKTINAMSYVLPFKFDANGAIIAAAVFDLSMDWIPSFLAENTHAGTSGVLLIDRRGNGTFMGSRSYKPESVYQAWATPNKTVNTLTETVYAHAGNSFGQALSFHSGPNLINYQLISPNWGVIEEIPAEVALNRYLPTPSVTGATDALRLIPTGETIALFMYVAGILLAYFLNLLILGCSKLGQQEKPASPLIVIPDAADAGASPTSAESPDTVTPPPNACAAASTSASSPYPQSPLSDRE